MKKPVIDAAHLDSLEARLSSTVPGFKEALAAQRELNSLESMALDARLHAGPPRFLRPERRRGWRVVLRRIFGWLRSLFR